MTLIISYGVYLTAFIVSNFQHPSCSLVHLIGYDPNGVSMQVLCKYSTALYMYSAWICGSAVTSFSSIEASLFTVVDVVESNPQALCKGFVCA